MLQEKLYGMQLLGRQHHIGTGLIVYNSGISRSKKLASSKKGSDMKTIYPDSKDIRNVLKNSSMTADMERKTRCP